MVSSTYTMAVTVVLLLALCGITAGQLTSKELEIFKKNVTIVDHPKEPTKFWMFNHSGIPHHTHGPFPNKGNPNSVTIQNHSFRIPKNPVIANVPGCLRMGPIGMAINGIPLYNPYTSTGGNAIEDEVFDNCGGHPQNKGAYHYHAFSKCLHGSSTSNQKKLFGVALDGFPIYYDVNVDRSQLDACNGRTLNGKYEYAVTKEFPYILGCYKGGALPKPPSNRGKRQISGTFNGSSCIYAVFCEKPANGCPPEAYKWDSTAFSRLQRSTTGPTGSTSGPSGSTSSPSGSTSSTSGSTSSSSGSTSSSSGSKISPRSTSSPSGSTIRPSGSTRDHSGSTRRPSGTTKDHSGSTIRPSGSTMGHSGSTSAPTGSTSGPSGSGSGGGLSSQQNRKIHCPNNTEMCLETGKCVNIDPAGDCEVKPVPPVVMPSFGHYMKKIRCPEGTEMCLETGKCVNVDPAGDCDYKPVPKPPVDMPYIKKMKCPEGTEMCLETGKCVNVDPAGDCEYKPVPKPPVDMPDIKKIKCPEGTLMCFETGKCVASTPEGDCDQPSSPPSSGSGSGGNWPPGSSGGMPNAKKCGPNQEMCLETGTCVDIDTEGSCECKCGKWSDWCSWSSASAADCNGNNNNQQSRKRVHCEEGKIFCTETGKCVNVDANGDCDPNEVKCSNGMEFNQCGSECIKTCTAKNPVCIAKCVPKCECPTSKPYLLNGQCEPETSCSVKCSNGMEFNKCGSACTKSCTDKNPVCLKPCVPKCECPTSKPYLLNGQCEPETSCSVKPQCSNGMVFNECASPCPKNCTHRNPLCIKKCVRKCECPKDKPYMLNGQCEPEPKCPVTVTGLPLFCDNQKLRLEANRLLGNYAKSSRTNWFLLRYVLSVDSAFSHLLTLKKKNQLTGKWEIMPKDFKFFFQDEFSFMFKGISTLGYVKATLRIVKLNNADKTSFPVRQYNIKIMHLPENVKPSIALRSGASADIKLHENTAFKLNLSDILKISDSQRPERKAQQFIDNYTNSTVAGLCIKIYNKKSKTRFYITPRTKPTSIPKLQFIVPTSKGTVKVNATAPVLGFSVDENMLTYATPGTSWSGTEEILVFPIRGDNNLLFKKYRYDEWDLREKEMKVSTNVGDPIPITFQVTKLYKPPELPKDVLLNFEINGIIEEKIFSLSFHLPYQSSSSDKTGFKVGDLLHKYFAGSGLKLDLAVIMAEGEWKAILPDGKTVDISTQLKSRRRRAANSLTAAVTALKLSKLLGDIKTSGLKNVLKEYEKYCAVGSSNITKAIILPANATLFPVQKDLSDLTFKRRIVFSAMDRDKLTAGTKYPAQKDICLPLCANKVLCDGFAIIPLTGALLRKGCDGRPGSMKGKDKCNNCGGNGKCVKDCNGDPGGEAESNIITCGECVGGNTGRTLKDIATDCAGLCLKNNVSENVRKEIPLYDKSNKTKTILQCISSKMDPKEYAKSQGNCDGYLRSTAKEHCNQCVGGHSGKTIRMVQDICGVCNGDGKSCLDCANVPKGNKTEDKCKKCLDPDDPNRDKSCKYGLGDFSIQKFYNGINSGTQFSALVSVGGTGAISSPNCKLVTGQVEVLVLTNKTNILASGGKARTVLKITITSQTEAAKLITGNYTLKCSIGGQTVESTGHVFIYDKMNVKSITPSGTSDRKVIKITVSATQVSPTVKFYLLCPSTGITAYFLEYCLKLSHLRSSKVEIPTFDVSSSSFSAMLNLNKVKKPMVLQFVALQSKPTTAEELKAATKLEFTFKGTPSSVVSMDYIQKLCQLVIGFDRNVQSAVNPKRNCISAFAQNFTECCKDLFSSATFALFGKGAECKFNSKSQLIVFLTNTPKSGVDIVLSNAIKETNVDPSLSPGLTETSFILQYQARKPKISLSGNAQIGSCDPIVIRVRIHSSRKCGLTATFQWTVTIEDINVADQINKKVVNDTDAVNKVLSSESKDNILIDTLPGGYNYTITVKVTVNGVESTASFTVWKKKDKMPLSVTLKATRENYKPTDTLRLKSTLSLSKCFQQRIDKTSVSYAAINCTANLDNYKSLLPRIKPGTFYGGKSCKIQIKVTVTYNQVEQKVITAETVVTFKSMPLQLKITGVRNGTRVIKGKKINIDSSCTDYNKLGAKCSYMWECFKENDITKTTEVCSDPTTNSAMKIIYTSQKTFTGAAEGKYILMLTVTSDSLYAKKRLVLYVVKRGVPVVTMKVPAGALDATRLFRIKAKVCAIGDKVEAQWKSTPEIGYDILDLSENCRKGHNKTITKPKPGVNCFLNPLVCNGLKAGAKYKFEIVVTNTTNNIEDTQNLTATLETQEEVPPLNSIRVVPDKGNAYDTLFQITVDLPDTDRDFSIDVTFNLDDGNSYPMSSRREVSQIITLTLPPGTGKILVKVCPVGGGGKCQTATSNTIKVEKLFNCESITVDELLNILSGHDDELSILHNLIKTCKYNLTTGKDGNGNVIDTDIIKLLREKLLKNLLAELTTDGTEGETSYDLPDKLEDLKKKLGIIKATDQQSEDVNNALLINVVKLSSSSSGGDSSSFRRRKKRAVANPSSTVMTENHVSTVLETYSTVFQSQTDSQLVKTDVSTFVSNLDVYMTGLCNDLSNGNSPIVIQQEIACMTAEKRTFNGIKNETLTMGNCSTYISTDAMVKLEAEIESLYTQWTCEVGTSCLGACIASYQLNRDMLTITSNLPAPFVTTRRSHILNLVLINPQTGAHLVVSNLATPIDVIMPLTGVVDLSQHSIVCRQFINEDWLQNTCNVTSAVTASSTEVTCTCNTLAPVSLFEDTPVVTTTPSPTVPTSATTVPSTAQSNLSGGSSSSSSTGASITTGSGSTTTTGSGSTSGSGSTTTAPGFSSAAVAASLSFSFSNDLTSVIGTGENQTNFLNSLKAQLAAVMSVNQDRISDLSVTSGTTVSFKLKKGSSNDVTLSSATTSLKNAISTGSMGLIYNNSTLPIVASSYSGVPVTTQAPPTTTKPAKAESDNMALIIGCAAGGLVVVVIIVIIIVLVVNAKSQNGKKLLEHETPQRHKGQDKVEPPPPYTSPRSHGKIRSPAQVNPYIRTKSPGSTLHTPIGGSPEPDGMPSV